MLSLLSLLLFFVGAAEPVSVAVGADRILDRDFEELLRNRTIGVISNPTGVTRNLTHVVDLLHARATISGAFSIRCVFGPEHGFRGDQQAGQGGSTHLDGRTGLPVYAAYGHTVEELARTINATGIDTLIFDIQDIGVRFYTFIWTMFDMMRAAAMADSLQRSPRAPTRFVVLDRPNPLGGSHASGPMLRAPAFLSGVGGAPIPLLHGMTIAELASLFNDKFLPLPSFGGRALDDLRVVPMRGWTRGTHCSAACSGAHSVAAGVDDLLFVAPSPNMPTCAVATVYPGMGLFEGTTLSEGRGTTQPFQIVGAPFIDWRLADALRAEMLSGVAVREVYFTPTFSKFTGATCGGIQLYVTDASSFDSARTGLVALSTIRRLWPSNFSWALPTKPEEPYWIDLLLGSNETRLALDSGLSPDRIVARWEADDDLHQFRRVREQHLLYEVN